MKWTRIYLEYRPRNTPILTQNGRYFDKSHFMHYSYNAMAPSFCTNRRTIFQQIEPSNNGLYLCFGIWYVFNFHIITCLKLNCTIFLFMHLKQYGLFLSTKYFDILICLQGWAIHFNLTFTCLDFFSLLYAHCWTILSYI